jgi:hypothetical protein
MIGIIYRAVLVILEVILVIVLQQPQQRSA